MHKIDYTDLLGKEFELGAKGPNKYDCYALSREVCKRAGIMLPDKQAVKELVERSNTINAGKEEDYIKLEKPEPYCIVTFSIRPPYVTHMGVVLEDCNYFIHIMRKRSVAIERLDTPIWQKKLDGYYRYVGHAANTD